MIPKNPHDEFFKAVFGKPENTAEFLRKFLPTEVSAVLDLNSLKLVKDSLVGKELKSYYSDLLFTVKSRKNIGYVYILFEHKSYKDRMLPLQLLRYIIRLYDRHLRTRKDTKHLPFVVPVVFYHGKLASEYLRLKDLFLGDEVLLRYVPDFEYDFVNITQEDDARLRGEGEIHAAMLLMKHIFDPDFPARVPEIMELLSRIYDAQTGIEAISLYLQYIVAGAVNADPDALLKTLNQQGGKLMPSLAKKLYDEGLEDGLQEGRQEGLQEGVQAARSMLLDLIEVKFGTIDPALSDQINKITDLNTLQKLSRAVKTADSQHDILKTFRD